MKNFFTQIFVALGIIFLVLILAGVYFFITDPFNLKPMIFGTESNKVMPTDDGTNTGGADTSTGGVTGFQLSEEQKQALADLGIDPDAVPTTISAEQEACFVSALGASRVSEIKAGAVPNPFEFMKAKSCVD
jgi:hypothetical protein